MNAHDWLQLIVYVAILLALAKPLGTFMARVYQGERTFLDPLLRPIERLLYRAAGVRADEEMSWKVYAVATMLFNGLGLLAVYGLQRLQGALPLNPQGLGAVTPDSAWNTAVSRRASSCAGRNHPADLRADSPVAECQCGGACGDR